jgi:hypothetical protein
MSDYVSIANLAASKIGEDDQLRAPDQDSHLGRTVAAVWNTVRRAAIRDHTWNFATRRAGLAAEALAEIPYPWAYSYPLPAQSIRLVEILNPSIEKDYQLEGRSVLCNTAGPLYVRYLIDIEETALWDDLFVAAFASRLAWQIGPRIAGSGYDKAAGWQAYKVDLNAAKRVDAVENPPVEMEAGDWETSRLGYGSGFPARPNDGSWA